MITPVEKSELVNEKATEQPISKYGSQKGRVYRSMPVNIKQIEISETFQDVTATTFPPTTSHRNRSRSDSFHEKLDPNELKTQNQARKQKLQLFMQSYEEWKKSKSPSEP